MSKSEIIKYIDNYKKSMLDSYQYELKKRDIKKETDLMEDDEEEFIGGI